MMVIRRFLSIFIYSIFGWEPIKSKWDAIFGFNWRGYFLGLVRCKAIYMVKSGETVILGGVFTEDYVQDYLNIVGNSGRVVVAEANPENAHRLKEIFEANENVTIINRAIWNRRGKISFLAAAESEAQAYNRIEGDGIEEFPDHLVQKVKKIQVETSSLDQIAEDLNLGFVHHINLTINGAEFIAIDGIKRIHRVNPKLRLYINSQRPDPANNVVARMKSIGFKVFTSNLIRTTNRKIRLMRIYACGQSGGI
jgi:FkbM family methyltransferase